MGKKAAKKKTAAKKGASSKASTKKSAPKKSAARPDSKGSSKSSPAKKTARKSAPKQSAGAKSAPSSKRAPKSEPKTATAKKSGAKRSAKAGAPKAPAQAETTTPAPKSEGKTGRKGITIVTQKPTPKPKPAPARAAVPALTGSILGMGLGSGKPLIPSGPKAPAIAGPDTEGADGEGRKPKSPFNKKQLEKYQEILLLKRRELLGDIDSMESEALMSQSGSLSHLPQHMAEQGSETYEQSLSLDLAAADRLLLREIDAALVRIRERTYGLCERTGKPISKERLAELPWARYSIEAAREMERRTTL